MRKKSLLILLVLFSCIRVYSSSADSVIVEKTKVEFSGFFRGDYWYDSRQIVDAVDGLLLLYPKKPELDANGDDIQSASGVNALAMGTRLRTKISMPSLFKAKSMIMVEGDFTAMTTSSATVRLRHAYTKLQWEKSSLLFGLTWHPMFVLEVFPNVASLNTGAPFQSFNRSPQLTFQHKLTQSLTFSISAIHQSDSRSIGPLAAPNEASSSYLRTGLIPNINTGIQFINGSFTIGGAFDFKSLRPRLFTTSIKTPTQKFVTNERINSYSGMLYLKYQTSNLSIKLKGMYGQNLYEHLLLGGYAVSGLDSLTGKETYTPTNNLFLFGNITYGKVYQIGAFIGYSKNLGTTDNFVKDRYYGRGMDIDYLYRIAPCFTYVNDKFQISSEFEYTASAFGDIDNNNKGKVLKPKLTGNFRAILVVQYSF